MNKQPFPFQLAPEFQRRDRAPARAHDWPQPTTRNRGLGGLAIATLVAFGIGALAAWATTHEAPRTLLIALGG